MTYIALTRCGITSLLSIECIVQGTTDYRDFRIYIRIAVDPPMLLRNRVTLEVMSHRFSHLEIFLVEKL